MIDVKIENARSGYTGRLLTQGTFDEAIAVTDILHREILKTGSFREKLTDYAHAFSRGQKFDALRGESILRDIFKDRNGLSMNTLREGLLEREAALKEKAHDQAVYHAKSVEQKIKSGDTMPFYKAFDQAAIEMARKHGITETASKRMMKKSFEKAMSKDFYQSCKALEAEYHTPEHAENREQRKLDRSRSSNFSRSPS